MTTRHISLDILEKLLSAWGDGKGHRYMDVHRYWLTLHVTSQKSNDQTTKRFKQLEGMGFIEKKNDMYFPTFEVSTFKQERLIKEMSHLDYPQYEKTGPDKGLPALFSFDGQRYNLKVLPFLKNRNADEGFATSCLLTIILQSFQMLRMLNLIKKMRECGIDVAIPIEVVNACALMGVVFESDIDLSASYEKFQKYIINGNPFFKEGFQRAIESNSNKPSIKTVQPYLGALVSLDDEDLALYEKYLKKNYPKGGDRTPEEIIKELKKIEESIGRPAEAANDEESDALCTVLAYEIVRELNSDKRRSDLLALVCTSCPDELKEYSVGIDNIVKRIETWWKLTPVTAAFPDEQLIDNLPRWMSMEYINDDGLIRLKLYFKKELGMTDNVIEKILQEYFRFKQEKFKSNAMM